uniref:Uncharacterized protein n=1 Tax=Uncultured marine euryarchaeote TaxID=257466 RepID=A0A1B0Z211_UNCAR|nr:hypothetical protein [uncultured marine euryarchaeote]
MIQGATQLVTTAPQKGSLADTGAKIMKWIFILIGILILVALIWFVWQIAEYDYSVTEYLENEAGVTDTGDSGWSAFFDGWLRLSPAGLLGGALGIGVTGYGSTGAGNQWSKGKDSLYTALKRLFGG